MAIAAAFKEALQLSRGHRHVQTLRSNLKWCFLCFLDLKAKRHRAIEPALLYSWRRASRASLVELLLLVGYIKFCANSDRGWSRRPASFSKASHVAPLVTRTRAFCLIVDPTEIIQAPISGLVATGDTALPRPLDPAGSRLRSLTRAAAPDLERSWVACGSFLTAAL